MKRKRDNEKCERRKGLRRGQENFILMEAKTIN